LLIRYIKVDYPENVRKLFLGVRNSFFEEYSNIEIEERFEEIE